MTRCRKARFHSEQEARQAADNLGSMWRPTHCGCGHWHLMAREAKRFHLSPAQGRALLRGDKTTHRIRKGRTVPCPYIEGRTYELAYRHEATLLAGALVTIDKIAEERLEDIDDDRAATEGFNGFASFLEDWQARYGGTFSDRQMAGGVWVLHLSVLQEDTVRLLVDERVSVSSAYTDSAERALDYEPEAIDPTIIEKLPASMEAHQRWTKDRAERLRNRQGMTPGELLDAYLMDAKDRHIDVHGPLREIQRQTKRIRRRVDPEAA